MRKLADGTPVTSLGPGDRVLSTGGRSDLHSHFAYLLPDPNDPGKLKEADKGRIWVGYEVISKDGKKRKRKIQWSLACTYVV